MGMRIGKIQMKRLPTPDAGSTLVSVLPAHSLYDKNAWKPFRFGQKLSAFAFDFFQFLLHGLDHLLFLFVGAARLLYEPFCVPAFAV